MRTTIHLPDDLLAQLKRIAVESRRTLTGVIEDALRQSLARTGRKADGGPARLPTFDGGGLQPGVDLDDSASLLDRME
jgi:predicted transcriptional regulator